MASLAPLAWSCTVTSARLQDFSQASHCEIKAIAQTKLDPPWDSIIYIHHDSRIEGSTFEIFPRVLEVFWAEVYDAETRAGRLETACDLKVS